MELGEYVDRSDLLDKISFIEHEGKGTNTGDALSYLHVKVSNKYVLKISTFLTLSYIHGSQKKCAFF